MSNVCHACNVLVRAHINFLVYLLVVFLCCCIIISFLWHSSLSITACMPHIDNISDMNKHNLCMCAECVCVSGFETPTLANFFYDCILFVFFYAV